jgi:hypothetical protein
MLRTLDRFADDEIPLAPDAVLQARVFVAEWAENL